VNDPSAARVLCSGARHGVVHVLGSVSTLIGTADTGGTRRRPVDRPSALRNRMRAEHVAGDDVRPLRVVLTRLTRSGEGVKDLG
jgi:hypothetical protein